MFESLLRRVQRGEFLGVFAAPPCSTFSISRFQRSNDSSDGGPPVIRRRSANHVDGIQNCPAAHVRELRRANELVARTCTILKAAFDAGTEFAIENPADRGDPSRTDLFMEPDHAPLWLMPDIINLSKHAVCKFATFPFCAFGVDYPKQTTLMYSRGLSRGLQDLDLLRCEHGNKHNDRAGGEKTNGVWNSAAAGAYPPDLNLWLAQAYGQLKATHREIPEHPVVARFKDKATGLVHEAS